jgi:hypothetical protein
MIRVPAAPDSRINLVEVSLLKYVLAHDYPRSPGAVAVPRPCD